MRFNISRKVITNHGWRWVIEDGLEVIAFSEHRSRLEPLCAELNANESSKPALTQDDFDSRPKGFVPQGNMRQLVWNAANQAL